MEDLLQQVADLQEVVRRLCNIREAEKELAGSKCSLQWTHSQTAKNSPTGTHSREGDQ